MIGPLPDSNIVSCSGSVTGRFVTILLEFSGSVSLERLKPARSLNSGRCLFPQMNSLGGLQQKIKLKYIYIYKSELCRLFEVVQMTSVSLAVRTHQAKSNLFTLFEVSRRQLAGGDWQQTHVQHKQPLSSAASYVRSTRAEFWLVSLAGIVFCTSTFMASALFQLYC